MLKGLLKKVASVSNLDFSKPKTELNAKDIDKSRLLMFSQSSSHVIIDFHHISNHIKGTNLTLKKPVRIVVTGGVLSVLLYRNRDSTKDIDFFHEDGEVMRDILDSKDFVPNDMNNWPGYWINCEMIAFVNNNTGCEDLYRNSINQNIIIWRSEYLEVYAADLKFQLVGKIVRAHEYWKNHEGEISGTKRGTKDLDDAISILYMIRKQKAPLLLNEVRNWYHFGRFVEGEPLDHINSQFKERYGYEGILTSSAES